MLLKGDLPKRPLAWINSTLLKGNAAEAVARLKQEPGKDLVVMGSGELAQSLMRGSGRRLFPDGGAAATLRLVGTKTTSTGVVIATYQPAGPSARSTSEAATQ